MEKFESFIQQNLPQSQSFHPHYEKALQEMLQAGGKRFRPALLLGVVRAYNPLLVESAYHAAYAIELLHTYSLIHDDLPAMDNSPLRRGKPTLHVTYDEVTAILVGDALNTYAFEILAKAPFSASTRIELVELLAYNGGLNGMVLGQAIDCHFEKTPLKIEDIRFLHKNKTAKLIAASLAMGAVIVDKKELKTQLYDFGLDLGLLFQIQDDILDVTQSSEEAGKLTQNDGDKNSFVTILGFQRAMQEADTLAQRLLKELEGFDAELQTELNELLLRYITRHQK